MSQIYSTSGGTPPPSVPTQFTADDGSIGIPVANNLNLSTRDVLDNNDNGIETQADPNGSDDFYVQLTNRQVNTVQTTDDTLTPIFSEDFGVDLATYTVFGFISAYNVTDNISASFGYTGGYRKADPLVAPFVDLVELGVEYHNTFQEAGMATSDIFLTISGNSIVINVQGIVGKTINWKCLFEYQVVGD